MAYHRLLKWGLGILLVLFMLLQSLVFFWINPLIERGVSELVKNASNGLYYIASVNVDLKLLTGNLVIKNFRLEADTLLLQELERQNALPPQRLSIYIPRFSIKNLHYRKLIYEDVIDVKRIFLFSPKFSFEKLLPEPNSSLDQDELESSSISIDSTFRDSIRNFDLFAYLAPNFKAVRINQILVEEGKVDYEQKLTHISHEKNKVTLEQIRLNIEKFYLDSLTQLVAERPFFADKVEFSINVSDYAWYLPDSTYKIEAESISFSSDSQQIAARGISFHPTFEALLQDSIEGKLRPALLDIHIPRLVCQGLDIEEIVYERRALLNYISIYEPNINLLKGQKRDPFLQKSFPDPNEWIKSLVDSLVIKEVGIEKGNFRIIRSPSDTISAIFAQEITAKLFDLRIDSLTRLRKDQLLFSDDLSMEMRNFGFRSRDRSYVMRGDTAHFSLSEKRALLGEFWLIPELLKQEDRIEAHVPWVELTGIDPIQVWREGILALDSLKVLAPEVSYTQFPGPGGPQIIGQVKNSAAATESTIDTYLSDVQLEHLMLTAGTFYLNDLRDIPKQEFQAIDVNLSVDELQLEDLNELDPIYPFYASEIAYDIDIVNYHLNLPDSTYIIDLGNLYISSKNNVVKADSVHIYPGMKEIPDSTTFDIIVPHVVLSGIDLEEVYKKRELDIDSLWILFPDVLQIQLTDSTDLSKSDPISPSNISLYQHIEPYLSFIHVDYLRTQAASFKQNLIPENNILEEIKFPAVNLTFHNFHLDSLTQMKSTNFLYSEDITVELDEFTYPLSDSIHEVSSKGISFSTEAQSLFIDEFTIQPAIDSVPIGVASVNLILPNMYIEGINAFDIWEHRLAHLTCISLDAPLIYANIYSQTGPLQDQPVAAPTYNPQATQEAIERLEQIEQGIPQIDSIAQLDLYTLIESFLLELRVDTFRIDDGQIFIQDLDQRFEDIHAKDVAFRITHFELDSLAHQVTDRPFYANDISLDFDIQEYALTLPDSSYQITLKDIGITTADSLFFADNVELIPLGPTADASVKGALTLERLQLEGVNPTEFYFQRILHLNRLKLIHPSISLTLQEDKAEQADSLKEMPWGTGVKLTDIIQNDPYERIISPYLAEIALDEIVIDEGEVKVETAKGKNLLFPKLTLIAYDFLLNEEAYDQLENTYFFAGEIDIQLDNYKLPLSDSSNYDISTKKITLSSKEQYLMVDGFNLIPKYSKEEFAKKQGFSVDRMEFSNELIELAGLDVPALIKLKEIRAESVHLIGPDLYVYKDKNFPFPNKTPSLPTDALRNLEIPITIDTVLVSEAHIRYDELVPKSDSVGYFTLTDLNLDIFHLSNDPVYKLTHPTAQVNAQGYIMGEAKMDVEISLPLDDTSNTHTFKAQVAGFQGRQLNGLLENIVFISISEGYINKINFEFKANNQASKGKMKMYYDGLKIQLMGNDESHERGLTEKLGSAIANTFVLRSRNPKHGFLRVGKIEFEREVNKAFVTYWVKSVVAGLKSSVGLTGKEEKTIDF